MAQSSDAIEVLVKRLPHGHDIPLPRKMTEGSSGCDLAAAVQQDIILNPGQRSLVPTGFCFEVPRGFEVQIRPRSGLAIKHGITILNAPGTIDSDYRGEVKIILANLGDQSFTIRRGDRIAQAVVTRVPIDVTFTESESISDTGRNSGGFGHSGLQ
jgi:dUTP pyrophosphatase